VISPARAVAAYNARSEYRSDIFLFVAKRSPMVCKRALKGSFLSSLVSLSVITLVILIALAAPSKLKGGSQPTSLFLPAVTYFSGGNWPESVAVADVNGDGKPDLAVADTLDSTVGVLLGKGDGTFRMRASSVYRSGGLYAQSVSVADVNGDGRPDLLVAVRCRTPACTTGAAGVLLGNGNGTFRRAARYNSGGLGTWWLAVGDVNSDGKPDLVVANADSNSVGVLLGNGDGTFNPGVSYDSGGYSPRSVAVADVNGDGNSDVLVANLCAQQFQCEGAVGVLLGNGDGTFQPVVAYDPGGENSGSVAAADLNGDGRLDLLVVNVCGLGCGGNGTVGVLLGNGDGSFQSAVAYDSGGQSARSVAVGDVDGDGKPDLAVANSSSNTVGVLLGNGDGAFQLAETYSSGGSSPEPVTMADVNGDAKPDLLVGNFFSNTVGVLLNNTTEH
jgi:hypothetical protein